MPQRAPISRAARGVAAGLVMIALLTAASRVSAYPYTHEWSPKEGPPGVTISLSGTGCAENGQPYDKAYAYIWGPTNDRPNAEQVARVDMPIAPDGSFSGALHVPADVPLGPYELEINCVASDMNFGVAEEPFEIRYPPPPTTTTVTTRPPATTSTTLAVVVTVPASTTEEITTTTLRRQQTIGAAKSPRGRGNATPVALGGVLVVAAAGLTVTLWRRRAAQRRSA